jgi:hypothetical protein
MENNGDLIEGSIGNFVGDIQAPSSIHTVDTKDRFSVLRHYNRGISGE